MSISPETFLDDRVSLFCGDNREVLRSMPDCSIHSIVTDPPYAPVSIVKRFGKPGAAPAKGNEAYARASAGFMGKQWDTGEVAFDPGFSAECLRILKPGGHLVAFSGTRTYHRMTVAIEDAGFEIRDQIGWCFGSGFPKSHDVSKGIDRRGPPGQAPFAEFAAHYEARRKALGLTHARICAAGGWHGAVNHGGSSVNWANGYGMPTVAQWNILQPLLGLDDRWKERVEREGYEREKIGERAATLLAVAPGQVNDRSATSLDITAPGSLQAAEWQGWGTALKPAWEPIALARKPLIGTVAQNVLEHGTGAINVDGCRVNVSDADKDLMNGTGQRFAKHIASGVNQSPSIGAESRNGGSPYEVKSGRWPANIIHDGSEEVLAAFPESNNSGSEPTVRGANSSEFFFCGSANTGMREFGDSGSVARFFYTAKADASDRVGSKHPTVKPIDLMQWLVRLVTPKGGTVLDPFAGTGTTAEAAFREGMRCILIEREAEYQDDIRRRMALVLSGPDERARESIKAKTKDQPVDAGPLFGGVA